MYFPDQTQLLSTLEEDWSILLKSIKNRQELHYQLLHRNKQILFKDRTEDDQEENAAEIGEIKILLNKSICEHKSLEQEMNEMTEKYQNSTSSAEQVYKIMTRVASKVLQITQAALDKSRSLDISLQERHSRMKRNLVNMLARRQRLNLEHIHNLIFDYGTFKVQTELLKMQKLLKALEEKQYSKLNQIYHPREKPRMNSVERIRQVAIQRKREYSFSKQESTSVKKNDQNKKQKNKILSQLYGIMVLSKYQFIENYTGCSEERKEKLLNELLQKNKKNHSQILQFRESQQLFEEKIRFFEEMKESQEKELPDEELKEANQKQKEAEKDIVIVVTKEKEPQKSKENEKEKVQYPNLSFSQSSNHNQRPKAKHNESISFREFLATEADTYRKDQQEEGQTQKPKAKLFGTRNKFHTKEGEDFPQLLNTTIITQQNQCLNRLELVRKNIKFEGHKAKLPDIYRKSSMDGKTGDRITKLATFKGSKEQLDNVEQQVLISNRRMEKWFRDDKMHSQRTKMVLKNVEVGIPPMNSKREDWLRRQQTVIVKGGKKMGTFMGETTYCKRTFNRFFDGKLNGIV